jgi:N-acetylglucosaminyldiphosphoundecaprenol N-acetyl-beta-D-mannosaminyltransferase
VETRSLIADVTRIRIIGVPVDIVKDEDFERVASFLIGDDNRHQIVFLSLWDLMKARRDKEYRQCVENASLVIPVSRGILRGAGFLKKTVPYRYMPFDFIIRFFRVLEEKGKALYLLGSDKKNLQNAEQNLKQTFPGMKIVGRYTGSYPKEMEKNILLAIKKASPHFVLAGSGIRGRDLWIYRNKKEFARGVFLWDSPILDIFSGKRKKVSREVFQKGREYFPDLFRKPWRLFRSLIYVYFALLLIVYRLRKI